MHSYSHGKTETTFHYNSDFSGNIVMCTPRGTVEVPGEALRAFIALGMAQEAVGRPTVPLPKPPKRAVKKQKATAKAAKPAPKVATRRQKPSAT